MGPFGRLFFYSLYTNWVLWRWSNLMLQACPLCGTGVEKYRIPWFIAQSTAESIYNTKANFSLFQLFYFFHSADQRLQNENICYPWFLFKARLGFSFSPLMFACYLCLGPPPNLTGVWVTCKLVFTWRSNISCVTLSKWFELVTVLFCFGGFFSLYRWSCINPQGTEHGDSID